MTHIQSQLELTETELRIRNYSPKTLKSYLHYLREYFAFRTGLPAGDDGMTVKRFLLLLESKGASAETRNLCLSAIKFYLRNVVKSEEPIVIRAAKRNRSLPVILSREEIHRMLELTKNVKHRLMLALAYGAGLRVSEVVVLRVGDMDLPELTLHIKQAKGRKDRISVVPEKLRTELGDLTVGKNPTDFVFASQQGGQLTTRTAQKIFEQALARSGVTKDATFHGLLRECSEEAGIKISRIIREVHTERREWESFPADGEKFDEYHVTHYLVDTPTIRDIQLSSEHSGHGWFPGIQVGIMRPVVRNSSYDAIRAAHGLDLNNLLHVNPRHK